MHALPALAPALKQKATNQQEKINTPAADKTIDADFCCTSHVNATRCSAMFAKSQFGMILKSGPKQKVERCSSKPEYPQRHLHRKPHPTNAPQVVWRSDILNSVSTAGPTLANVFGAKNIPCGTQKLVLTSVVTSFGTLCEVSSSGGMVRKSSKTMFFKKKFSSLQQNKSSKKSVP